MGEEDAPRAEARWEGRRKAAWLLRAVTVVVPLALSVLTIALASRLVPRPAGAAVVGWYVGIFAVSWLVLWVSQRALHRLLPMAMLLELTLCFPDRAPSRLRLARRAASSRDLTALMHGPLRGGERETTQQAAERILSLVGALAQHDRRTRGHAERVRAYTDLVAEKMSLPSRDRDRLQWAALLHDIGKLHVPATLLNKPSKPTADEWNVLREHPDAGARLVAPLLGWLGEWGDVIAQHHERFDGTGYPRGIGGHDICLGGRIVAVADSLEVMTAARAYKRPVRRDAALRELVKCSGTQFDPEIVRTLLKVSSRRMMFAMGPASWLASVPLIGQAPAQLAAAATAQTTATLGAVALVSATGMAPAAAAAPVHRVAGVSASASAVSPAQRGSAQGGSAQSGLADRGPAQGDSAQQGPSQHAPAGTGVAGHVTVQPAPPAATPRPGATPVASVRPTKTPAPVVSPPAGKAGPVKRAPAPTKSAPAPVKPGPAPAPTKSAPAPTKPTKSAPAPRPPGPSKGPGKGDHKGPGKHGGSHGGDSGDQGGKSEHGGSGGHGGGKHGG